MAAAAATIAVSVVPKLIKNESSRNLISSVGKSVGKSIEKNVTDLTKSEIKDQFEKQKQIEQNKESFSETAKRVGKKALLGTAILATSPLSVPGIAAHRYMMEKGESGTFKIKVTNEILGKNGNKLNLIVPIGSKTNVGKVFEKIFKLDPNNKGKYIDEIEREGEDIIFNIEIPKKGWKYGYSNGTFETFIDEKKTPYDSLTTLKIPKGKSFEGREFIYKVPYNIPSDGKIMVEIPNSNTLMEKKKETFKHTVDVYKNPTGTIIKIPIPQGYKRSGDIIDFTVPVYDTNKGNNIEFEIPIPEKGVMDKLKSPFKSKILAPLTAEEKAAKTARETEIIKLKTEKTKNEAAASMAKLDKLSINKPSEVKEIKYFDFHESIMKPIFYKFYPIMILILYAIFLCIISISVLNILMYVALSISNTVTFIFNDDICNYYTLPYKTVLKYLMTSEKDYTQDPLFIFTEQYFTYTNIDIWFLVFLTLGLPLILYIFLFVFYKFKGDNYVLKGNVKYQQLALVIIFIMIAFLIAHTVIFKYFFGSYIYDTFKTYKNNVLTIDDFIQKLLYINGNIDKEVFYENLETGNRELINECINGTIDDQDQSIKKIFTYILHKYFGEIINGGNKDGRELLHKYITADFSDPLNTFIGLLNYKKRMVRRYYTDLNFIDKFISTKAATVEAIKLRLDDNINKLNKFILDQENVSISGLSTYVPKLTGSHSVGVSTETIVPYRSAFFVT